MIRCPICNSENYHINFGYGAYCEDCGFEKDAEGETRGGDENE
jgi:predicted Zn-ribbon and HTH transcriptional regulator